VRAFHTHQIAGPGEEVANIRRRVREFVARVDATVDLVEHPTSVRLDEAPKEWRRERVDDRSLPIEKGDRPVVLGAGTVLGKKTRPMLRGRVDTCAARSMRPCDAVGEDLGHRQGTVGHQRRVGVATRDAELEDTSTVTGDVPIAEIEAEEICLRSGWDELDSPVTDLTSSGG